MAKTTLLICVVGPTAIGKTRLAIELAKYFETEIISADSRQFFKEMTIGTAVPSQSELAAVPHHFIQNRSVREPYNVGDYEKDALALLDRLFKKHKVVIMVGGSGLYIDAVIKGLDVFPNISEGVRENLMAEYKKSGLTELQTELQQKDPEYFNKVDRYNHHRVIRALEVIRETGKPFSSYLNKQPAPRSFQTCFIGLTADREVIYDRINRRVDQMLEDGLLLEAKELFNLKHLNALQTVGYRELFRHFEGLISLEEAISEIKKNTRRFAKRQGTWFRKNDQIEWFHYNTAFSEIIKDLKHKNAIPE